MGNTKYSCVLSKKMRRKWQLRRILFIKMFSKSGLRLTDLFGNLAGSRRRCETQLMVGVEPKSVDVPLLGQNDSVISGRCNLWAVMGQKTLHHSGNLRCEHGHKVLESRCAEYMRYHTPKHLTRYVCSSPCPSRPPCPCPHVYTWPFWDRKTEWNLHNTTSKDTETQQCCHHHHSKSCLHRQAWSSFWNNS